MRWKKAALENCTGVPCVAAPSFTCGTSTISDFDGNVYETVSIGTQCWTKTNLEVSKYNNGSSIPTGLDNTAWQSTTSGAYAIYNNALANESIYGKLYNWYVVVDSRGLCPTGWHVPIDAEWTTLTDNLGGLSVAGGKMKSTGTTYWFFQSAGTDNSSGFTALPGSNRACFGPFNTVVGVYAFFWSATENGLSPGTAWDRNLYLISDDVTRFSQEKSMGASVRCLKD